MAWIFFKFVIWKDDELKDILPLSTYVWNICFQQLNAVNCSRNSELQI
jgi:hypothetical protein